MRNKLQIALTFFTIGFLTNSVIGQRGFPYSATILALSIIAGIILLVYKDKK